MPLPRVCLVQGQPWLEWGCSRASLGLPASLRGLSELRCLGSTCMPVCLAMHPPPCLPASPGTHLTTRSSPGYPNPAWGRLLHLPCDRSLHEMPCAFLPSRDHGQPPAGTGGLTEQGAFGFPAQLRLLASRSWYLPAQSGEARGPHHKCTRPDANGDVRRETKR